MDGMSVWDGRSLLSPVEDPRPLVPKLRTRICPRCRRVKPRETGFRRDRRICVRCFRVEMAERRRAIRAAAKARGECMCCAPKGVPALPGMTLCAECRERKRHARRARRRALVAARRCVTCTGRLPEGWELQRCPACREAVNASR